MSRIGKRPVSIPSGVTAEIANGILTVKGPKGTLTLG
jgi:large subunit ribosomal protein L6